ncbi:MAG: bifunctional hydroxymethylpyrimidine kinase/phosphomethylpyrimidine kinase [Acidimicrobiales bacterium]
MALTVAGTDSSGGAGVTADCATFIAHGLWPAVAVTAVTAQNTLGVGAWEATTPEMVRAQMLAVAVDVEVAALKTGMLASAQTVASVAETVAELGLGPLVVDPVWATSRGQALNTPGTRAANSDPPADLVEALLRWLIPLAKVVTPNLAEAAALSGRTIGGRSDMVAAAAMILEAGAAAVMITGGHLAGDRSPDLVMTGDGTPAWLEGPRLTTANTHGTGCVLSAALCAGLAQGLDVLDAARQAKGFVTRAITGSLSLGMGPGPVDPRPRVS